MTTEKCDITPNTIVGDLLRDYPELEDKLIEIAPVFNKLKNPVLRKTVAKVATLKQAAQIAGMPVAVLINKLREAVNMEQIQIEQDSEGKTIKPGWVDKGKIVIEYDASLDIENGLHPAAKVTKEITNLKEGEIYLLITPFLPAPLIKIVEEKGYKTYSEKLNENTWNTYIGKQ
ncbi:DUF1858 domain-containing protein [Melioribacter sp. Ez-97]|uniref:DUF1858 domain-containing protein n=1 Tax=Melioribacter sp. Ez-97 TaxID=3423434 RepID=UPI003ED8737C